MAEKYVAKRYDSGDAVEITVEAGRIRSVDPFEGASEALPLVGPGFFDIQINGGWGVEFSSLDLTAEKVISLCEKILGLGVFRFCPTLTTYSDEAYLHTARTIAEALDRRPDLAPMVVGLHLEGPFISRSDGPRGAHPLEYCRPYDLRLIDQVQEASGHRVKIVTLSPEYDGAEAFIAELTHRGIIVALGHTDASPVQIARAAAAGARLSTHLANATHHLIPKAGNYFFAQLIDDRLQASVIADGFHLSPMMLRTILRTKGKERLILISDQAQVAGLPPGKYATTLCDLEMLPSGKVVLSNSAHLLAGASYPISRGICNMAAIGGLSLFEAYEFATTHPAALLGEPRFSNGADDFLAPNAPAEFLIFRVKPSKLGPLGAADTDALETGAFELEQIITSRGREASAL